MDEKSLKSYVNDFFDELILYDDYNNNSDLPSLGSCGED